MFTRKRDIPDNQEIYRLENHLYELADLYRKAEGDAERRQKIITSYHRAMKRLYELGWNEMLTAAGELPEWLMPDQYLQNVNTHAGVPEGFFRQFRRKQE